MVITANCVWIDEKYCSFILKFLQGSLKNNILLYMEKIICITMLKNIAIIVFLKCYNLYFVIDSRVLTKIIYVQIDFGFIYHKLMLILHKNVEFCYYYKFYKNSTEGDYQ